MKPVMTQNKFLQSLPKEVLMKFDGHVELAQINRGDTDKDSTSRFEHVYFPLNCVYSLEWSMSDGINSHLALLGYRDAIGARNLIDLALPGVVRAIIPGYALKIRSEIFAAEMVRWPEVRRAVHSQFARVTEVVGMTSGCNLRHPLQRRLARWLLSLSHASGATAFDLTHEDLAHFLGVRREAITEALARLAQALVIKTSRGRVQILDLGGLEGFSCECNQVLRTNRTSVANHKDQRRIVGV